MAEFKYLFSPIDVGPMRLRNRIVSTPHTNAYGKNNQYNEREVYYQAEKAKGGAAMLCTGIQVVDPEFIPAMAPTFVPNVDDSVIPWYRRISDAIHEYGARYAVQLGHEGGIWQTMPRPDVAPLLAASAIPSDCWKEVPVEIEREELERIAKLFGLAAARAKAGGCDGIEIHAGHGELLMSFYSPLFNTRTDEFSGPMENRLRPLFMIIDEIRKVIGRDLALGVRISGDEFMEGGATIDDAKAVCKILDKSGQVDWIDVSSGNLGSWLGTGIGVAPMYVPLGAMARLAAAIKEVVSIPVIAVGRITDPVQAEKILADGHADLVGMTRALIADPQMPNKAKAGQLEDIRHCVGACICVAGTQFGTPLGCIHNPVIGREKEWAELKPAPVKKKVMVIGGGPAGLEASRVAALRGHTVTLYEKNGEIGGQVLIAARAPTRQELSSITRWLILQVRRLGVKIHLNIEVTPELVAKEEPDAVVVATGSIPRPLSIPGATGQNLVDERSVLSGKVNVGQRVIVLDGTGDTQGSSVTEFLAEQGKQVYVLAKGYQVGENINRMTRPFAYRSLLDKGVILMPFTWIRSISGKDVITYNSFTFKEDKIENIDTVVSALPAIADNQLWKSLKGKVRELYAIGDCVAPRRIQHAIYEGMKIGREL